MRHLRARRSRRQRREAGVSEQAQQLYGPSRESRRLFDPIPIARLIRKHSHVPRGRGLHPKLQILPSHDPSFRNGFAELPLPLLPTACFPKLSVCRFPWMRRERRFPSCLCFRTDQHDFTEPLELLSIPAVYQLIVRPLSCECFHVIFARRGVTAGGRSRRGSRGGARRR